MPVAPLQFEWLLLHSRLLSCLALSLMAQDILLIPREEFPGAVSAPDGGNGDALHAAPDDVVDWFDTSDLSDDQVRELRESAERELAAFDNAQGQRLDAVVPGPGTEDEEPLDFERELELAYAQRDAVAADAQAAFGRIDHPRLDALLEAVDGGGATLTERMRVADLAGWLQLMKSDDVALNDLLNYVLKASERS